MSSVLVASPSAFLRIGLLQQLRRRQGNQGNIVPAEAATAAEAVRILAGGGIDLAIVDDALMVTPVGDRLVAAIERHHGRALVIATRGPQARATRRWPSFWDLSHWARNKARP